ncbi:DUF4185 domain-containing protein [Cohnella yongneupensis]|uniref:DUF4185 domain-containing protein n=1 Tax=Cohnella yongneupensis TaxID=425006 RepID=A0ABW0R126_9BACL
MKDTATTAADRPHSKGDRIPARRIDGDGTSNARFDFEGTYAVASIVLNGKIVGDDCANDSQWEYSLNGKDWKPAIAGGSCGEQARYVRVSGPVAALPDTDIQFIADSGFAVEPADEWTNLFHKKQSWSGSDGIYSIPVNGVEAHGTAARTTTVFVFGDTFVGNVDERTDARDPSTAMLNNTLGIMDGAEPDPEKLRFVWREGENGDPLSAIVPTTPKATSHHDTYYWLQDGASIGGHYHGFPLIIGHDPDGPEGFQFAVHGITHVTAPLTAAGPDLSRVKQTDTPLYFKSAGGHTTYFGAAIMPNTAEAGVPQPDGYVYIYGLQHNGIHQLVAARVLPEDLADIGQWTYWNGGEWTDRKEDCAPIAPEVSCELSVSRMTGGSLDGKYVVLCQLGGTTGNRLAIYSGDSPVGPFGASTPLYYCPESEEGRGIYTYNAKGHPHLSAPGELLISYNVNTTSMEANMAYGSIYRPRFVRLRQIP